MDKIAKEDWGYVNVDPDPDFDPIKNQRVIDNVIKKNEKLFKKKEKERKKALKERTTAIASFLEYAKTKDANITPDKYFGDKYLAELRGNQIIEMLKDAKAKRL